MYAIRSYYAVSHPTRDDGSEIAALIVPHAGYIYSGEVAATTFATLDRDYQYQNIFLIGASHHNLFPGVCVRITSYNVCYTKLLRAKSGDVSPRRRR